MAQTKVPLKSMQAIPQDTSATCWLAGYRMMFQWKQKSESSIENLLKWEIGDAEYERCTQEGLLRKYWGTACDAFDMYGHSGRNATSFDYVKEMLDSRGPVLFHYTRSKGIHTVVMVGYDEEYKQIVIIDPWWDPGTAKTASTYPISFGDVNIGIKGSDTWAGVLQHW